MKAVFTVATKEYRDGLRNRWILSITILLAIFAIGLAYFGAAASGSVGVTSLSTTIVSLASLAIFIIPLVALMLAYDTIVGEEEQGTLLLLLTYPLTRRQMLMGKFIGHAAILATATLLGFGLAGLLIAVDAGELQNMERWGALGFFILSSWLLGCVFLALAQLLSAWAGEKSIAAGVALLVWFWFVLIFDLLLLGLLVMAKGQAGGWLSYLLLLNPTDIFRLANFAGFEAARNYTGLTHIAIGPWFRPGALLGLLLAWVIVPLLLAQWRFRRRPL
ncbi:MAG: ABC transporter permease subunit [Pseudomonadota bacterium]